MCPCSKRPDEIGNLRQAALHFGCGFIALWRFVVELWHSAFVRDFVRTVAMSAVILGMLWFFLMATGCQKAIVKPRIVRPPVVSAPVVAGQMGKDATVLDEAAKIDAIAPEVKEHTDAQRAAVAANPAQDVAKLVAEFEARIKEIEKDGDERAKADAAIIAQRTKERDEARNETDRAIVIGGYAFAAILVAAGVATFFLMAQLAFLGPKIGYALIGAGSSVFVMLQAYQWTKAHPWITGITLLFLVAAGALAFANHLHAKDAKSTS
jgi:hypothetical protein